MFVANQKEMQLCDRYTIEQLGLPGVVLMENAGNAVVQEVIAHYSINARVFVIAGGGNNGGDGFVIARRLIDYGFDVMLCLAVSEDCLKGDAKIHFEAYKNRNLPYFQYNDENQKTLQSYINNSDVIIDAILGTGVIGNVRYPFKEIIETINRSNKEIIAVDIPSGVNANTGEVANVAVKATKTVTFAMPKIGFFIGDGPQFIGEWKVVDISVPLEIVDTLELDLPILLDEPIAKDALPKRIPHGHKGTFGHCFVIGGCTNYIGAPIYTAKAAFHTGVGLVSLAIPKAIYPIVATQCPEILLFPIEDESNLDEVDFSKFKVIAFGPGLGREVDGEKICETLLSKLNRQTIIIDADGLYFIKNHLHKLKDYEGDIILTPHPGEMATLTGVSVKEVEKNRIDVAKQFAVKYGVYLLLKGHRSIIATPEGKLWINPYGNDALGKGGSGDVLTGLLTSFTTQGATPLEAMQAASYYHATSAEQLGKEQSNYGITPTAIIDHISKRL